MTIVTISGGVFIDKLIKHNVLSTSHGRKLAQCMGRSFYHKKKTELKFVRISQRCINE